MPNGSPQHIVRSYDADLEGIRRSLAEMGGMAERMLGDSTIALIRRDTTLSQKIISADQRLDIHHLDALGQGVEVR